MAGVSITQIVETRPDQVMAMVEALPAASDAFWPERGAQRRRPGFSWM